MNGQQLQDKKCSGILQYHKFLRYFTRQGHKYAKCNICNKHCKSRTKIALKRHLVLHHFHIIKEKQNKIKCTDLAPYFKFDVGDTEIRCVVNDCRISIFCEIAELRNHLYECRKVSKSTQKDDTDVIQQLVTKEHNTNTNDDQQLDAQSIERRKELCNFFNNVVSRYFNLQTESSVKCNICHKDYDAKSLLNLEFHFVSNHFEIIEEVRKEIERSDISSYFVFDAGEYCQVKCIYNKCNTVINIFHGINGLRDHLYKCHNKGEYIKAFESTQNNNVTDVMIQQSEIEENNKNIDTDEQQSCEHLKNIEYKKELSWENYHGTCKLIWTFFTPKEESSVKCNICNKCYKHDSKKLKTHINHKHPEIIEEIRNKVRSSYLSPYFKFDVKYSETRCIFNDCIISIFCGINGLKKHLIIYHKINKNHILQGVLKAVTPET